MFIWLYCPVLSNNSKLPEGMYDISVRAIDRAGSVGPADLSDPHTLGSG